MGIFDQFQFDPQTYAMVNPLAGLLQRLPEWQWQNPNSQGFTPLDSGIGNAVKPPVIAAPPSDNEPQRGPPLNISPPPMAAPQAPQASPLANLFSGISNGIADNPMTLMALGSGIMQGGFGKGLQLALMASGADQKNKQSKQAQNATVAALLKHGLDQETASVVAGNPQILTAIMQDKLGLAPKTEDIKEFEYAKKQGFDGGFVQWMQRKRAMQGEYGLNPVYGVDKEGKAVILQLGKTGETIQPKLPEGVTISKEPIKLDVGTHFIMQDPITRQTIATIPKNIEGKEAAEERGKALGKAQVELPNTLAKADQSIKLIDDILSDKNLPIATGAMSVFTKIPGTPTYDVGQKMEQLKGKAFLEAFESLKGGGQITEVEGKKATDAIARLSSSQTTSGYTAALKELREVIATGMESARAKAGQPTSSPAKPESRITIDIDGNVIR